MEILGITFPRITILTFILKIFVDRSKSKRFVKNQSLPRTRINDRSGQNCKRNITTNSLFQFRRNTQNYRNFLEIRGTFVWANIHTKHKNVKSLDEFKSKIKVWKCDFCQCRLCKKYVQIFGFI